MGHKIKSRLGGPNLFPYVRHGMSGHPLYRIWNQIRFRCYNRRYKRYKDWGGRGIRMCLAWKHDPRPFIEWAIRKGWKPGLEIDRRNNNKGYSPANCRFVNDKVQASNRRQIRDKLSWKKKLAEAQHKAWNRDRDWRTTINRRSVYLRETRRRVQL